MPTGEVSALFWALVGLGGGAAVTAYSIEGPKARNLWVLSVVLVIAAAVFRFGAPSWAGQYAASAVQVLWALYPMLTIGAVVMVMGDKRSSTNDLTVIGGPVNVSSHPRFATAATTKWTPDINLREAVHYLGARSTWRYEYAVNDVKNSTEELTSALSMNKITAWGREHPGEGELYEIRQGFWSSTDVTIENDYVFSKRDEIGVYDVQLCQKEMEQVWPPKKQPGPA
jgi:hypothetical protein